jgi:kynurenine formamidase
MIGPGSSSESDAIHELLQVCKLQRENLRITVRTGGREIAMTPEGAQSNWGKWGPEDERGTANYIHAGILKSAAGLIRRGKVYSLALPIQQEGVPRMPNRPPLDHRFNAEAGQSPSTPHSFQACDDYLGAHVHNGTHIDALAHCWTDGQLYNGISSSAVHNDGAVKLGIEKLQHLVGRGVLLDLCRFFDVPSLPAQRPIGPSELEQCAKSQGTELREGDILLVRTGWLRGYNPADPGANFQSEPGLNAQAADWVLEKRFAAVGADNFALEAVPSEDGSLGTVHLRLIRDGGCYIMELLMLEQLAEDRVYEFLFVASPLPLSGGTGSPINPLAIA